MPAGKLAEGAVLIRGAGFPEIDKQLLAKSDVSRAEAADGSSGGASAGQPSVEDEEEKARRLARAAAGGAPQLAMSGPIKADIVASPMGAAGDGGAPKIEAAA